MHYFHWNRLACNSLSDAREIWQSESQLQISHLDSIYIRRDEREGGGRPGNAEADWSNECIGCLTQFLDGNADESLEHALALHQRLTDTDTSTPATQTFNICSRSKGFTSHWTLRRRSSEPSSRPLLRTHTQNHFTALWTLSRTTRVSWHQKVHFAIFWIFWSKTKITQADAPTICMDCHPIQTNWCPHLRHPHHFYAGCPSLHNPPNLSWLGTGTKYAGLHIQWLDWGNKNKQKKINEHKKGLR